MSQKDDTISRQEVLKLLLHYAVPENGADLLYQSIKQMPSTQSDAIPVEWIQEYADDWEYVNYAYENPILGMLEDWRDEQNETD